MTHTSKEMPVWAQGLYTFLIAFTVPFYCLIGFGWMSPQGVFAMFQTCTVLLLPLLYWNRAKYTRMELKRMAAIFLLIPTMFAGFGFAFYYTMEVQGQKGLLGKSVAAMAGTGWILGLLALILKIFPGGASLTGRYEPFDWSDYNRQEEAARAKVIADMEANERLRKYIPEVREYHIWSIEEAEYLDDPSITVTCRHLRQVEAALRGAGLSVRRTRQRMGEAAPQYVFANVVLKEQALRAQFPLAACVKYTEYCNDWEERGPRSDARLYCEDCRANIQTHHPEDCLPNTPVFPVPPT